VFWLSMILYWRLFPLLSTTNYYQGGIGNECDDNFDEETNTSKKASIANAKANKRKTLTYGEVATIGARQLFCYVGMTGTVHRYSSTPVEETPDYHRDICCVSDDISSDLAKSNQIVRTGELVVMQAYRTTSCT